MLGKKKLNETGKLPSLIKTLEGTFKLTKFGLDDEMCLISRYDLGRIMELLSKKQSTTLVSLSLCIYYYLKI